MVQILLFDIAQQMCSCLIFSLVTRMYSIFVFSFRFTIQIIFFVCNSIYQPFTLFVLKLQMYVITFHSTLNCSENLNLSLFSQSYINGFLCFPPVQNSGIGSSFLKMQFLSYSFVLSFWFWRR